LSNKKGVATMEHDCKHPRNHILIIRNYFPIITWTEPLYPIV